jgi:hypothetical protein
MDTLQQIEQLEICVRISGERSSPGVIEMDTVRGKLMKIPKPAEVAANRPSERGEDTPMKPSERYNLLLRMGNVRHALSDMPGRQTIDALTQSRSPVTRCNSRRPGLFNK